MIDINGKLHKNSASKSNRYRPEIDGLRAFAVVAVIINHFNKDILPGGYLGVDIFFVISGYVITSSLYGRPSKNFKDFICGFYERRIKRLIPALSAFVLITSFIICFFNANPGYSLQTGLTSLFGLSNIYLLKQSIDYFAEATELNVFAHTWSLGVEEQFYILFPLLIWFSGFGQRTKNGSRNLFLIVGALTIASLIGFLYLYSTNQSAAYYLMPARFWEMAVGCLIFIGFQKSATIEHFLEKVPPFLVLALIISIMYLPMSLAASSTIAVVGLSSVLIASLKQKTLAFKVFTNPKVVYIGLISYSLYLWHWGVVSISRWTVGIHWWSVPFQVVLMLGLAIASYKYIETPIRKRKWFVKRWKTLVVGIGELVIVGLSLVALGRPLKGVFYTGKFDPDDFMYIQDILECELAQNRATQKPLECIEGDYSKNTIYVLGDSHASNLVPSSKFAAFSNDFDEFKYLTNAWADKMDGKDWYQNDNVQRILDKTNSNDLIIWSSGYVKPENRDKEIRVLSEIQYLSRLSRKTGVKILLVDDLPDFGGKKNFLPKFIFQQNGPFVAESIVREKRQFHTNLLKKVIRSPDIFYLDPLEVVCRKGLCGAVIDDKLIYADSSPHFNKFGATILSELLSERISQIKQ